MGGGRVEGGGEKIRRSFYPEIEGREGDTLSFSDWNKTPLIWKKKNTKKTQ